MVLSLLNLDNTGRFIMHSGITKIYYRKKVGHVFMNPVQIEEKTLIFILLYILFP